jgi:hypothetical protein
MSTDFRFPVTFFRDFAASEKWERKTTLPDLANRISSKSAARKEDLPWLKLARFGEARSNRNSLRHDANVTAITGIEADYDGEAVGIEEATETIDKIGVLALLYTSPSHSEDAPRWRVLCPLSEQMPPIRRQHLLGRLNGAFRGIFAPESWKLSQAYYWGSVNNNPSHKVEVFLGHTIDQLDDLDEGWIGPPADASGSSCNGSAEARGDAELIRRVVTGEGFHVELCALAARYVGRGIPRLTVSNMLRGFMLSHPEVARDERWHARVASVPDLVESAIGKFVNEQMDARRAVARLTWQMAEARRPAPEIKDALLAEAKRTGLDPAQAVALGDRILNAYAARVTAGRRGHD